MGVYGKGLTTRKVAANVVFGEEKSEPLLGVTVPESAGFIVDPIRQILKNSFQVLPQ